MPRTPYRASEGNALNNPPCPITPTLTSSSVHHSSHQLTTTFLSYYNVTLNTFCAVKQGFILLFVTFETKHLQIFMFKHSFRVQEL